MKYVLAMVRSYRGMFASWDILSMVYFCNDIYIQSAVKSLLIDDCLLYLDANVPSHTLHYIFTGAMVLLSYNP